MKQRTRIRQRGRKKDAVLQNRRATRNSERSTHNFSRLTKSAGDSTSSGTGNLAIPIGMMRNIGLHK